MLVWFEEAAKGEEDDADGGREGSGFTVMLDLALSVLEPVIELKRELASFRGIVASNRPSGNKGTDQPLTDHGHSTSRGLSVCQVMPAGSVA